MLSDAFAPLHCLCLECSAPDSESGVMGPRPREHIRSVATIARAEGQKQASDDAAVPVTRCDAVRAIL